MDKKIIKQHLTDSFLSEAKGDSSTPGIAVTKAATAKSGAINKKGVADMDKELSTYDKDIKKTAKTKPVKYNYNNDWETTYHDQMEIMNGQEMIEYDRDPNDDFKARAKEAIEGSSRMGNKGGKGMGNAEETWGAAHDDFGKNLVKDIKASTKKRQDAVKGIISFGDDIETVPKNYAPMAKHSALKESDYGIRPLRIFEDYATGSEKEKDENEFYNNQAELKEEDDHIEKGKFTAWCKANGFEDGPSASCAKKAMASNSTSAHKMATFYTNTVKENISKKPLLKEHNKLTAFLNQHGPEKTASALIRKELSDNGLDIYEQPMYLHNQIFSRGQENISMMLSDGNYDKAVQEAGAVASQIYDQISENNNNKKPQIKESMKRLNFKKEFNGVGNALKMIPESYRVNDKKFEMTDGNESYTIRWEGTLNEGRAVILQASNKSMVNEDILRMKKLMGYKSQDTLGLVKGNARLNENVIFGDFINKTRVIMEGEDIESQNAPEGEWEEAEPTHASEAKKDVEGSVKTDKKVAPNVKTPKTGEWEEEDPNSSEAKSDVEGSVKTDKKVAPNLSEPKKGYWEEIKPGHASEATAHLKEGVKIGNTMFRLLSENYEQLEEELEEEELEEDVLEETEELEENLEEDVLEEDDNINAKKKMEKRGMKDTEC